METTFKDTGTQSLFEDEASLKLTPEIDRGYPIVNGRAVPLLSLRMHADGSASIRVGHLWLHGLWPDKRLQLLAAVRRYNGTGAGNGNGGSYAV